MKILHPPETSVVLKLSKRELEDLKPNLTLLLPIKKDDSYFALVNSQWLFLILEEEKGEE